jgi:MFS family permease
MASTDAAPELSPLGQHRRQPASVVRPLETPRAAGVAGLAFAALFIASVLLLRNHPAGDSTAAEIRDFYVGQNAGRIALVGVYLAPFAGIAFLWFIAVIRNLIGDREDRFFATVFLGSGLLFVAMLFISAGAGGALMAAVKFQHEPVPSPDTVVTIRSLAFGFLFVYAMRMAAVFMIVVSTIGMRLGILPRWLVVGGYAAALVLILNVSYIELLILVFPAWVAAVSVVILRARPHPRRNPTRAPSRPRGAARP